jgi:hypothetical protein
MGFLQRHADAPLFPAAGSPTAPMTHGSQGASHPALPGVAAADPGAPAKESLWQRVLVGVAPPAIFGVIALVAFAIGGKQHNGAVFLILSGVLMLGLTAYMFRSVGARLSERREHVDRSVVTDGVVTSFEITGVKGDASYSSRPVIRFTTAEGEELEVKAVQAAKSSLKRGDTTAVRYDPQDTTWMRVVAGEKQFLFVAVGGLLVLIVLPTVLSIAWGVALLIHG